MTVTASYRIVGRYLMCEAFASGGMASVHLGRLIGGEGFSRTIAVKQLYAHFARDDEFVHMFLGEARLLSRIRHPHVVAPLDVLRLNAELFIIMEYVHGAALSRLVEAQKGPVSLGIASALVQQTLLGLHAAHEAADENGRPLSIVHRDVSPQNILVDANGAVKVVDFGIAKAASQVRTTQEGHLKGKPGYLAPEQLRFEGTDRRADIFNAGIVLWELLSGERLFGRDSPRSALDRVNRREIPAPSSLNPEVTPELDAVVARALCAEAGERYQDAREMALALMQASAAAAPLALAEWVEGLIGNELRARERAIAAMELISPSDLTQVLADPRASAPAPSRRPPIPAAGAEAGQSEPVGAMLVNSERPPRALVHVRDSVGNLLLVMRQHAGSLLLSAALTIIILFAYDAAFRRDSSERTSSSFPRVEPERMTLPAQPTSIVPQPAPLAPESPALPVPAAAPEKLPEQEKAQLPPSPANIRRVAAPKPEPRATEPKPAVKAETEKVATEKVAGENAAGNEAAVKTARPCREQDLYTIDARGVKRWNKARPECYTWSANKGTK